MANRIRSGQIELRLRAGLFLNNRKICQSSKNGEASDENNSNPRKKGGSTGFPVEPGNHRPEEENERVEGNSDPFRNIFQALVEKHKVPFWMDAGWRRAGFGEIVRCAKRPGEEYGDHQQYCQTDEPHNRLAQK